MALKEGRCPNCGSIIQVNTEQENHCVFCWASVDKDVALALAEDASGHSFPNETYPEPSSDVKSAAISAYTNAGSTKPRRTTSSQPVERKKAEQRPSAAEQVAKINRPIPEVKVNRKALMVTLGTTLAVILIAVGIGLPLKARRDDRRASLETELKTFPLKVESQAIRGFGNEKLSIVVDGEVDAAKAREAMTAYSSAYRKIYQKSGEGLENGLRLKIYADNGSFYWKTGKGVAEQVEAHENKK